MSDLDDFIANLNSADEDGKKPTEAEQMQAAA